MNRQRFSRLHFAQYLVLLSIVHARTGSCPTPTDGNPTDERYLIREVLLKDYDPVVRPVLNPADPVNVSVSLGLKTVIALDMRLQTFLSFAWFTVRWFDQLLTWNSSDFNNITAVYLPVHKVWRPDLVIFNTVGDISALRDQTTNVQVRHDGRMSWSSGGKFDTYCTVDITYFPFDVQACSVDLMTWSLPITVLNGTFADPVWIWMDQTESHPELRLVGTDHEYVLRPSGFWVLIFRVRLQRKPLFYVVNIIVPMTLLSFLNCLVYVLPTESGEKMTVSVTSFLSLAVFVSFINDTLPQNSDSTCLFSLYVMVHMALSLCSTAVCAVTVNLASRGRGHDLSPRSRGRDRDLSPRDRDRDLCFIDRGCDFCTSAGGRNPCYNGRGHDLCSNTNGRDPCLNASQLLQRSRLSDTENHESPEASKDDSDSLQYPSSCLSCPTLSLLHGKMNGGHSQTSSTIDYDPPQPTHSGSSQPVERANNDTIPAPKSVSIEEVTSQTTASESSRCTNENLSENVGDYWKELTVRLDKLFLCVMICANLMSCVVFILLMSRAGTVV
ncbi:acetylcholine receptor subunit alpha-like [Littorina saxatilis]|uniref:acetylcholine receptor subunit alpha-like n=1 Tax=Littorina saxatilis TaxID=31220 RepID=UPI0038B440B2